MPIIRAVVALAVFASPAFAQATGDPFPDPIQAEEGTITVDFVEFASIPDVDGDPPRMMELVDEPGTGRLFVNDMRGPLYAVSYDGSSVVEYVDISDARWGVQVEASGREQGFQNFAFHPQFGEPDTPGYGRFYTWTDTRNTAPEPDFTPGGGGDSHDTVLLEWTARNPAAPTYDGGPPRELMRFEQPYGNHNAGDVAFNPLASPGDPDFGLLYIGSADGGSGGDPLGLAQNLSSGFGKILRIDPLGSDGRSGEYGIPPQNPFAGDGDPATLGEIYAYGVRNPQHLAWDPQTGRMLVADIGQNTVEEVSVVTAGANLGWNAWEGSFEFGSRSGVLTNNPRGDAGASYPIAEYDQDDPLVGRRAAVSGLHVYRSGAIPQLANRVLFGDLPSGEIFHVPADTGPGAGQAPVRRVLLRSGGEGRTLLEIIGAKNQEQGRSAASRADLRIDGGNDGRVFLLNKSDGVVRLLVPAGGPAS